MKKATIYDYARMCKSYGENCKPCPFYDKECELGDMSNEELQEANEIILNWCKEHPAQTRQDRFLKIFPNAKPLLICPATMGYEVKCPSDCEKCEKEYWLAEVDKNE